MRILTNMAFRQSPTWMRATDSLYDLAADDDPHFLPWWREVLLLWRRAPAYDVVVTMGVRESMGYGLLCTLTLRPEKQIMCEVFIDAPSRSPAWFLKNALYGFVARRALGLLTNSTAEVESVARRYRLDPGRIRYVPLNCDIEHPRLESADDGYVLCAGRTLRDYKTLVEAARADDLPWTVVCGKNDLHGVVLPPNLRLLREVSRSRYLEMLRKARMVALPLLPAERATGQVVMMEAMAMGKPVVTTRAPGTIDTIRDGENGLLVNPSDPTALSDAVRQLWNDPELRRRLGEAAVRTMVEEASAERHAQLKLEAIRELVDRGSWGVG